MNPIWRWCLDIIRSREGNAKGIGCSETKTRQGRDHLCVHCTGSCIYIVTTMRPYRSSSLQVPRNKWKLRGQSLSLWAWRGLSKLHQARDVPIATPNANVSGALADRFLTVERAKARFGQQYAKIIPRHGSAYTPWPAREVMYLLPTSSPSPSSIQSDACVYLLHGPDPPLACPRLTLRQTASSALLPPPSSAPLHLTSSLARHREDSSFAGHDRSFDLFTRGTASTGLVQVRASVQLQFAMIACAT